MSNNRKSPREDKRKECQSDGLFSLLYPAINSGNFRRCIRWCDEGSTVYITSPELFEKQVLRKEEWERELNIDGFASFVDALFQVGFEKVLNQRPSKVQKFRHSYFTKAGANHQTMGEGRAGAKTKRKMPDGKNFEFTAEKDQERNLVQKTKRQRKVGVEEDSAKKAQKRKRNDASKKDMWTRSQKRNSSVPDTPSVSINHDMPIQQMGRIYSAKEIAAQALLSLPTPIVFASYSTVELMAAQSLASLSRSCIVPQAGRSAQELEAAHALLQLANSA